MAGPEICQHLSFFSQPKPILRPALICFLLLFALPLAAQDTAWARSIMQRLGSPYYAGRGYTEQGDGKAALFIARQFDSIGVRQLPSMGNWTQEFRLSVNKVHGRIGLAGDGTRYQPAKDYLIYPSAPSIGPVEMQVIRVDSTTKFKRKEGYYWDKAILLPPNYQPYHQPSMNDLEALKPGCIIHQRSKLVYGVSQTQASFPQVDVIAGLLDGVKRIELKIESQFMPDYSSQNVIGFVPGRKYPDSFLVFCAHYDHLGRMGDQVYFPGANDNASGTAMLIQLAAYFAKHPAQKSLLFIAFGGEEAGLVGSEYFVNHPPIALKDISFVMNMDLLGNGQDGMTVVNGTVHEGEYNHLLALNAEAGNLKQIKPRGPTSNSDHYPFSQKGVPAFFVYLLGAYPWYHDPEDSAEKPTLLGWEGCYDLMRRWAEDR